MYFLSFDTDFSMVCFFCFDHCTILTGKPGFSKKQADLFFPPDFADDFPVAMQVVPRLYSHFVQNIEVHAATLVTIFYYSL